ncbi:MAG: hypothetical protein ACOC56_02205 [Atribacterota bacterium]
METFDKKLINDSEDDRDLLLGDEAKKDKERKDEEKEFQEKELNEGVYYE